MTESVLIAIVQYVGAPIIAALLAAAGVIVKGRAHERSISSKLDKIGRDAAVAKEQTTNTHSTNLRDDLDGIRSAVEQLDARVQPMTGQIRTIGTNVRSLQKDVGGLKQENRDDRRETHDRIDGIAERMREVERDTRRCPAHNE